MTFPVTKIKTRDAYGVTFSSPEDSDLTIRFKTNMSKKSVGGKMLTNSLSEVIYNDVNPVTVGTETVNDALSVRVRISGSTLSSDRISEVLSDIAGHLVTWDGEDVFIGFEPQTPPGA